MVSDDKRVAINGEIGPAAVMYRHLLIFLRSVECWKGPETTSSFPGVLNLDRLGKFLGRIVYLHFLVEQN